MTGPSPSRSPVTPSLFAPDISATVADYVDVFGFAKTGEYADENGVEIWAEVTLGEARIWLFSHALEGRPEPAFSGLIYVFVDDVDAMAEKIGARADICWGPESQDYGLRELGVRDVNGYLIVFAKDA